MFSRVLIFIFYIIANPVMADNIYQLPLDFTKEIKDNFTADYQQASLQVTKQINDLLQEATKNKYLGKNIKYWQISKDSQLKGHIFILNIIGKYKPITFGVAVIDGSIFSNKVLIYRESHGKNARFLSKKFKGSTIAKPNLINNISGSTMSVNAMKDAAMIALIIDNYLKNNHEK